MIRKNLVKQKLMRGEVVIGCSVRIPHPSVAEILGMIGFDYLMIDGEHGPLDAQTLENMVRACDSAGVVTAARLPVSDARAMLPFLESGILGVQIPHCRTKEDIQEFVDAVKYPPIGKRGVGPGRTTGFGAIPTNEHIKEWNEELLTFAMIEDTDGLKNMDEMLTVQGLDVIAIGQNDLSTSMGFAGNPFHPKVQEVLAGMVRKIRDSGRWASTSGGSNVEQSKHYADMGFQVLKFADVPMLRYRATELLKATRAVIR
jgi:4-hydroxy-2-oxoheptanedioate aldolase